jgi:predicted Rossmann-fold nucleotide-binding protein
VTIKRIAVYCGSAPGNDPVFAEAGVALIREMARAASTSSMAAANWA